ncbi:cytochrome P450 [Irpex rosettiformis]|uniref:Cytochrome P450 n=1 Tax=Irpex rosettiformis TaxID=378272 RepID=A0ACB8U434_9APHY|nr:cytochrome P450 [Irpex rosettiformis]
MHFIAEYDWILLTIFVYLLVKLLRKQARGSSPPGPRGLPFVGNAYQIPSDRQWLKFDEWIQEYGDVVQVNIMSQPTVILGSVKAATELLDYRGLIYSDRPPAVMAGELVGWNRGLGYSPGPHSPRFREFRRLFHRFMGSRQVQDSSLLTTQEENAAELLLRLLNTPQDFMTHVRQSTGALILRLTFGYNVAEDQAEDPLVKIVEKAMQGFARASEPGTFLVDSIPILKHIPSWVPGAGFKREAANMRRDLEELYDVPYTFVKNEMSKGPVTPSFVSTYIEEKGAPTLEEEDLIKAAAASLYSGGADTTPSSLASFILAMCLHPEIQARAQEEVDSILGLDWHRLPTFSDRESLPYVNAIVLELLRWNPAVPLGLAHQLTQDDVYRGWHLRKGTVVWANIWTMLHDEAVFFHPFEFRPDRFLDEGGNPLPLDPKTDPVIGFGFGRRICPGMYFADNSIFIAVVMMLYAFTITRANGPDGHVIIPEAEYGGFIAHPRPFKCTIKPRSPAAEALIRQTVRSTGNARHTAHR